MSHLEIKDKDKIDHRQLNKYLEIYFSDEKIGQGLPFLLKNGTIIKNLIQSFIRSKESEYNFEEVISPVLANSSLYEKSGHLFHYKEYIFPEIEKDSERFQLRPMTCPHHCIIFGRKIHSYRNLPLWICEHSILHRFEPSGSLKGLERARWMELSDNHVFATEDQLKSVFKKSFHFISEIFQKFNIKIDRYVCSLHDKISKKYHDDEDLWTKSENSLIESLEELGIEFIKLKGEAAFYGPKLDIEVESIDGKRITFATIQFDFVLPQKFNLNYIDKNGSKSTPVIVHYSSIGSYQRFISILIEQNQGKFPFWLSPVQFVIIPLFEKNNSEKILDFCEKIRLELKLSIRVEIWKEKRLDYRIRNLHRLRIPSYIVVGEEELNNERFILSYNHNNNKIELYRSELIEELKKMNN